jgi:hypothetical protein
MDREAVEVAKGERGKQVLVDPTPSYIVLVAIHARTRVGIVKKPGGFAVVPTADWGGLSGCGLFVRGVFLRMWLGRPAKTDFAE